MNSVTLKDAYKRFTLDQDKTLPPEETVRRFKEKLKKIRLESIMADWISRFISAVAVRTLTKLPEQKSRWEKEPPPRKPKQAH